MQASDIPKLSKGELRKFGLVTGAIFAVLFGGLIPWVWEFAYPKWPWIVFAVLGGLGIIAPMLLQPVYRIWMRFGLLISKVTTPIIMGIIFFLMFLPVGIVMRLFGRDAMRRDIDAAATTYRETAEPSEDESLENPY